MRSLYFFKKSFILITNEHLPNKHKHLVLIRHSLIVPDILSVTYLKEKFTISLFQNV